MKRAIYILLFLLINFATKAQESYYVLFDSDKALVPDTAMAHLIKTIYKNEVSAIYLEGHCDSIGSKTYNYDLSKRRVKAVEQLLVDNGYDRNKISGKIGFGKDKPIAQNTTADERQINRRVLVKFDFVQKNTVPTLEPKIVKQITRTNRKTPIGQKSKTRVVKKQLKPAKQPLPLSVENFKPNALIALPNLFFQGGRHFLLEESTASLDSLVRILKQKINIRLEIQGHVCCTTFQEDGYDWDNKTHNLSVTRAIVIKRYLMKQGIDPSRLRTKGFGGSQKLFPEEENSYQIKSNRRVEVMVLP